MNSFSIKTIAVAVLSGFIYMICYPVILEAQDKNTYWLHGYKSSSTFWNGYNEETQESQYRLGFPKRFSDYYRISSNVPSYSSMFNVRDNISTIANSVAKGNVGINKGSILVGHSMGGLVARKISEVHGGVSGIISVGSPHRGAVVTYTAQTLLDILRPTLHVLHSLAMKSSGLVAAFMSEKTRRDLAKMHLDAMNGIRDLGQTILNSPDYPTFKDMAPHSHFLKSIGRNSSMRLVSIYGSEYSPTLW